MDLRTHLSGFKKKVKHKLRIGNKKEAKITDREPTGSVLSSQSDVAAGDEAKGGDKGIGVKGDNLATQPDDSESAQQQGAGKGDVMGGINDTEGGTSQDDPGPHLRPGPSVDREGRDGPIPPVHPEIVNTEFTPQGVEPKRT
jgi:hypothetical protein